MQNLSGKNIFYCIFTIFLFFAGILFFYYFTENSREFLTVAVLDIGQGDAIFIEAPNGNQVLIDAGQTSAVTRQLSQMLPFYDRHLNLIIATHHDSDHTGGMPDIFKRYNVEKYATGSTRENDALYTEIERLENVEKSERIMLSAGDRIILDDGIVSGANVRSSIYLDILWPPGDEKFSNTNDASVVVNLVYGEISFLLTGDAPKSVEEKIVGEKLLNKVNVLKVGHHGSKNSTSENFVRKIAPQYAVISAGKDNKFGHPHAEVVEVLRKNNVEILETAQMGTIIFKSDGKKVLVDD